MQHQIRQNPSQKASREIKSGRYIIVMPPFTNDQLIGIPRIIHHSDEMVIPSDSKLVRMNDNPSQQILPFVNEIVDRVKRDMKSYGFVDNGSVSYDSIPKLQSGFRSLATQRRLFEEALANAGGNRSAARANVADPSDGPTPHMTGRAVDFNLLVPDTREIKTSPLENRIKMWNTRKWKVLNFLLTHKYKAMNYEREPWHYEFGKASERNLAAIKSLEAQGKIIGNPKLPRYLEIDTPGFDIEAARNFNNNKQTPLPYKPEFDVGSADFAFYVASKQKELGLKPIDGKMGPVTYNALVQDKNQGGDVPPVIEDLSNLPPTPFDIDRAFDFGPPKNNEPESVIPFRPSQTQNQTQTQQTSSAQAASEEATRARELEARREAEAQAQRAARANIEAETKRQAQANADAKRKALEAAQRKQEENRRKLLEQRLREAQAAASETGLSAKILMLGGIIALGSVLTVRAIRGKRKGSIRSGAYRRR